MDRIAHLAENHVPTYDEILEQESTGKRSTGTRRYIFHRKHETGSEAEATASATRLGTRIEHDTMTVEAVIPAPVRGKLILTRLRHGQFAFSLMNYLSGIWSSNSEARARNDSLWSTLDLPSLLNQSDIQQTLMDFWSQDWFNRAWILQEAVLPAKVVLMYRGAVSNLDDVLDFWYRGQGDVPLELRRGELLNECGRFMGFSQVRTMKILREARQKSEADHDKKALVSLKMSLLDLLVLTRTNNAIDARDKVYSLLGLAQDKITKSIIPDYSDANTPDMMFSQIAEAYIRSGQAAELLGHDGISKDFPKSAFVGARLDYAYLTGIQTVLVRLLSLHIAFSTAWRGYQEGHLSYDEGSSILVPRSSYRCHPEDWMWPWQYYSTDRFAHPLAFSPEEDPEQKENWIPRLANESCQ